MDIRTGNPDTQRRQYFENVIVNRVIQPYGRIDWYRFADIVDFVARHTDSDETFRRDLWHLFGWREGHVRSPLARFLDRRNRGLLRRFHNANYHAEQMHHYLGTTTGNTDRIPSHRLNNAVYSFFYELKEVFVRGQLNRGDLRLSKACRQHCRDFLSHGRLTVADNIRKLLAPFQPPSVRPAPFYEAIFNPAMPTV